MKTEICLSRHQLNRLRDIVGDKQDALFEKLDRLVATDPKSPRCESLRESLKFWDEIDRALRDTQTNEAN
jgi:hypothetical protein